MADPQQVGVHTYVIDNILSVFPSFPLSLFSSTDSNVTLLLTMVGGDSVTPTEVALVDAMGSQTINGTLENIAGGDYLVTMTNVPTGEFVVRVVGEKRSLRSSNSIFQRQSVTQFRASSVVITVSTVLSFVERSYLKQ